MNTEALKTQTRGICQCCGRDQAVMASGLMSKHGYTVDHGWFNGVCSGQRFKPLQKSRTQADHIVATVRADVLVLRDKADAYATGVLTPETVQGRYNAKLNDYDRIAWEVATDWDRQGEVKRVVWKLTGRAEMGEKFATSLAELADRVFGTELRTVTLGAAPAPIRYGEQRKTETGTILTVTEVNGARIYWKRTTDAGKTFTGWTGTQAFRKFEKVVAE